LRGGGVISILYGKPGAGKTCRMLYEVSLSPRVVLLDAKCGELARLPGYDHLWPSWAPGSGRRRGGWLDRYVVDYLRGVRERGEVSPAFRVVVHVRESFAEQFEAVAALLRHVRGCVLAVDELSIFLPAGSSRVPPAIQSIFVSGRHDGIEFMGTVQRPVLAHPTVRALAGRLMVYRITEANCLDALGAYLPPDLLAAVPLLENQVCVDWSDGGESYIDWTYRGRLARFLPV
jgi:hypothetical protein